MTIRMRPFGFFAMIEAWRRSLYFKWIGRKTVQRTVDRIVNPATTG
jgi:hypothetical protein